MRAAAARLAGVAVRTPLLRSSALDERTGGEMFLKAENLQRAGAFKIRGAFNKVSAMSPEERRAGVAAYSSGNHAQAVSLAAQLHGIPAVILMPEDAPASKVAATRGYGAEVVPFDRYTEDRAALGAALAADRGLVLVPPYDDPFVMAGQGTTGLEIARDEPALDVLMAPVGGGGLIAGSGTAAKALLPGVRVVGVEPEGADDTKRSLEAGERVALQSYPRTIADGLQIDRPGRLTFEVNRTVIDQIVLVSDEEIIEAMRFLFEQVKLVVEPSGAVCVAALLAGKLDVRDARVAAILSGGNIDIERFRRLVGDAAGE